MKSDPRICKIPMTEFNHLDLKEVAEWERLEMRRTEKNWPGNEWNRWLELVLRRVFPDRWHNKGDAA